MSWPPLLRSCEEKLLRADKHLRELDEGVKGFLQGKPKPYTREIEVDRDAGEVKIRLFVIKKPPSVEWGVLVGDAVHGLRSALDHFVWALTVHHQRRFPKEPIGKGTRGCWWRDIEFPIYDTLAGWTSNRVRCLRGIDSRLWSRFEDEQPFTAGNPYLIERHSLQVLHALWNRDKHRSALGLEARITAQHAFTPEEVLLAAIYGSLFDPDFADLPAQILKYASGPIEDGAVVTHLKFDPWTMPTARRLEAYLRKYAALRFDVAFEKGPAGYGGSVRHLLGRIHRRVKHIIEGFIGEFIPTRRIASPRHYCPPVR